MSDQSTEFQTYRHKASGWIFRARPAGFSMEVVPLVGPSFVVIHTEFENQFESVEDVRNTTPLWEATSEEIFEELARRFDSVALGLEKDNLSDVRISGSFNACHGLAAEIQEVVGFQKGEGNGLDVDG